MAEPEALRLQQVEELHRIVTPGPTPGELMQQKQGLNPEPTPLR